MYRFIHLVSAIIRQFLLPNPYSNLIKNQTYADLFNIVIGATILHVLSYVLTGFGYTRGISESSFGSLGYLISYGYLIILITVLESHISNFKLFLCIFIIIYIISCIIVNYIFTRKNLK